MFSIHGAVVDSQQATRSVLGSINDRLTEYFDQRLDQVLDQGGQLSDRELNTMLALLRQNQISAPPVTTESITDRARVSGKLNFGALDEKRTVVPFRRPSPSAASQNEVDPAIDA